MATPSSPLACEIPPTPGPHTDHSVSTLTTPCPPDLWVPTDLPLSPQLPLSTLTPMWQSLCWLFHLFPNPGWSRVQSSAPSFALAPLHPWHAQRLWRGPSTSCTPVYICSSTSVLDSRPSIQPSSEVCLWGLTAISSWTPSLQRPHLRRPPRLPWQKPWPCPGVPPTLTPLCQGFPWTEPLWSEAGPLCEAPVTTPCASGHSLLGTFQTPETVRQRRRQ